MRREAASALLEPSEPRFTAEGDERHRERVERGERVEVGAAGRMKGPDQSFGDIDKECERREGSDGSMAPPRTKAKEKRDREKEEQGGERDDEVGPERGQTNTDQGRQVRASARRQREEVLVPHQEDALHERDRGRTRERETAHEPRKADGQRDRASRDPGYAGRRTKHEREHCDAEERALGAREEQQTDEPAGDRAGADIARRRTLERDEEHRPDQRGDRERVKLEPLIRAGDTTQ